MATKKITRAAPQPREQRVYPRKVRCAYCGSHFVADSPTQIFCSNSCRPSDDTQGPRR